METTFHLFTDFISPFHKKSFVDYINAHNEILYFQLMDWDCQLSLSNMIIIGYYIILRYSHISTCDIIIFLTRCSQIIVFGKFDTIVDIKCHMIYIYIIVRNSTSVNRIKQIIHKIYLEEYIGVLRYRLWEYESAWKVSKVSMLTSQLQHL